MVESSLIDHLSYYSDQDSGFGQHSRTDNQLCSDLYYVERKGLQALNL